MPGQPGRGSGGADVDRVPRHVGGRVGGGDPSGSFLLGSVLGDRLSEKPILVLGRTPATLDDELDPVVRGMGCSLAQGTEQISVEVGYTRNLVVEDRRAIGDGTVSLANARRCSPRRTSIGDATVEDEDAGNW